MLTFLRQEPRNAGHGGRIGGAEWNSIAFRSAPRREADSQPISQLVRQAVSQTVSRASRQAERNTQFGVFQWQTWLQAVGRTYSVQNDNSPTVMHPTAGLQIGGSSPGRPTAGSADRPVIAAESDPRSNPAEHKLLPPPPPKRGDIQFQGIEASESKKSIGGLSCWAK